MAKIDVMDRERAVVVKVTIILADRRPGSVWFSAPHWCDGLLFYKHEQAIYHARTGMGLGPRMSRSTAAKIRVADAKARVLR